MSVDSSELSELWQLRRIPSTADGFYEEDAGIHATTLNVDVIALICQEHRLCRDDLKVVVYAALIPFVEGSKRFLGRCRGLLLLSRLLLKNAQGGKQRVTCKVNAISKLNSLS